MFGGMGGGGGLCNGGLMLKGGTSRFVQGLDKLSARGYAWAIGCSTHPASFLTVESFAEGSWNAINDPQSPSTTSLVRLGPTIFVKFALPVLPVVHPFIGTGIGIDNVFAHGGSENPGIPAVTDRSKQIMCPDLAPFRALPRQTEGALGTVIHTDQSVGSMLRS